MGFNLKRKLKGLFTKENLQKTVKTVGGYGKTVQKYGKRAQKVQGEMFEFPSMTADFDLFGSPKKRRKRKK